MSDEAAAVDEPGAEPVSPAAPEDESTPVEESAPTQEESPAEDADAGKPDAEKPVQGHSEAFNKLLAKYGGDYEKLASAYFEQANSSSQLHQEIREIKEMVAAGRKLTQEEEAKTIAEDPYVKELNEDLTATSEEAQTILAAQKGMASKYQALERKIASLEGEFKRADESDRTEVARDLAEARREMSDLSRDYKDTQRDLARTNTEWKRLQRGLREAEGQAKARVERERQEAVQLSQEAAETRNEYNAALRDAVGQYGIDTSSKTYTVLNETIKSRLYIHMQNLRAQGVREGIDLPKAVSAMMEEYAEAMGLKKSTLKTKALDKLQTLAPGSKTPLEGSTTPSKDKSMSASQWRDRARRLMP